ncbi:Clp1-domain-containing protein [Mycena olivaceomarginata]|nr:Clp1-domain-containing protein [Mycena olivaceomarginata]
MRVHAEVFGAELAAQKPYLFGSECKAAIFHLARMHNRDDPRHVTGQPSTEYVSEETPMAAYANLHIAFEQMRVRSLRDLRGSPGGWAAPGALSVAPVRTPLPTCSPGSPLGAAATSAPTALSSNALIPLAYWYGHAETKRKSTLDRTDHPHLGENITINIKWIFKASLLRYPSSPPEIIILDRRPNGGFASGSGNSDERQRLIKACVDAFKSPSNSRPIVLRVVELDHLYRERVHNYQLHSYFYGQIIPPPAGISSALLGGETLSDLVLSPSSTVINFGDLSIFRIGAETMAPSSALPIGAARAVSETQAVPIDPAMPGSGLLNAVLAILAPPVNTDESERYDEEILDLPISGFIVVSVFLHFPSVSK